MSSEQYRKIRKKWNEDNSPVAETKGDSMEDSEERFSKFYSQYIQKAETNSLKHKRH